MGCLAELDLLDRYASNRNDLLGEFYAPCLDRTTRYSRAVGYFRSSVLVLAARPVANFVSRGGTIRLVCCPQLTKDDIDAAQQGYEWRQTVRDALLRQIDQALADAAGESAMRFFSTLIAIGSLDIKIAFRPGYAGIFHDKVGVFSDADEHEVSFTGSANETAYAWDVAGNHESFDVFRSWTSEVSRVQQHRDYFESLWLGHEPGLEVIAFPDVARERLVEVADPDGVLAAYDRVTRSRVRTSKTPQIHQIEVLRDWESNGHRGIVDHATGGGKTITAISAIRKWLTTRGPVLITVPTQVLMDQWRTELGAELAEVDPRVLLVGAGHDGWRKPNVVEAFTMASGNPRVVLATMQTASTPEFRSRVRGGQHLLLVADEVHRVGSPQYSGLCSIDAGGRLGLSATPKRYGDPTGTATLLEYFGRVLKPPFTLRDGIEAGRLCPYTYHVHFVDMTQEERDRWRALTKDLKRELAKTSRQGGDRTPLSEAAKRIAIRRATIVKSAASKPAAALQVVRDHYADGERWLIYCDDQVQLGETVRLLRDAGLQCSEYHSAMEGDAQTTLEYFAIAGGLLVAIRCLDEGVNIPSADHALIMASSKNPREFIQRRGRVLRVTETKLTAEIHDIVVTPPEEDFDQDELSILRGELARAVQFARDALNRSVVFDLRAIAMDYGIDPATMADSGMEDDEDEHHE